MKRAVIRTSTPSIFRSGRASNPSMISWTSFRESPPPGKTYGNGKYIRFLPPESRWPSGPFEYVSDHVWRAGHFGILQSGCS